MAGMTFFHLKPILGHSFIINKKDFVSLAYFTRGLEERNETVPTEGTLS